MTTLREAAQMALNDLEALVAYIKGSEPDLVIQVPSIEALRAALATEQEPVAWYDVEHGEAETVFSSQRPPWEGDWKPLYTAPPQRIWQGLTDEELRSMCKQTWVFDTIKQWAKIIEAKLREKNT